MEIKNNLYINGKQLTNIKRDGRYYYRVTKDGSKIKKGDIDERKIECSECKQKIELVRFVKRRHFEKEYLCHSCRMSGEKNPFYGKNHDEETKKKIVNNRDRDYSGENNPMYNENVYDILVEKYGQEKADDMWRKKYKRHSNQMSGSNNHFYGKTHSEEVIDNIVEANKKYWENMTVEDHLKRNNLSFQDIQNIFDFYKSNEGTIYSVQEKFGIDFRTIQKYWVETGLVDEEELKRIKNRKRFQSNPSSKEEKMYQYLVDNFGERSVHRQFGLCGYSYDFLVCGELFVEYDGYYWHEVIDEGNDKIKDEIAEKNGYDIYRVKENKERMVDFENEISKIEELI